MMTSRAKAGTWQRVGLFASALAVVAMGTLTSACTPRTEQPSDSGVTNTEPVDPSEKNVQTNVTRAPMSAAPPMHTDARPCGFGPAGGGGCVHHRTGGGYGEGGDGGGDGGGGGGD